MRLTVVSRSPDETLRIGCALGKQLKPGNVVGLIGELGAGKTCFVKGIAGAMLDISEHEVTSPTFTILQEYAGPLPLYHFDAYRLSGRDDLESIGFDDYMGGDGVAVIEWADRISDALPDKCLLVRIELAGEHERCLTCTSAGRQYDRILERLSLKLGPAVPGVELSA